jgi:hypothetical protein
VLRARDRGGIWRYGVLEYTENPDLLRAFRPRAGLVQGLGLMRDSGHVLVMEEVPKRDADLEDRVLYWHVQLHRQEGRMLQTGMILSFYTHKMADRERSN